MSVFTPVNVEAPFDRKRQLLQHLMEQMQQNVGRGVNLSSGSSARGALGTGARPVHPMGGTGLLTHLLPTLSPGLQKLLGPGGVGHAIPGREASTAPGMAVVSQLGASPHGGLPISMPTGAGAPPIPARPAAPAPAAPTAPGNPAAAPTSQSPIPLGNGVYYDPVNQVLINRNAGPSAPTSGGSAGSRYQAI